MTEIGPPLADQMSIPKSYEEERVLLLARLKKLEDEQDWLSGMMTRLAPLAQAYSGGSCMPSGVRIVAESVITDYLSAITANMGLLTTGEIRLGTGTPGTNFTGLRLYKSGAVYRLEGRNNDVLQAYFDSDGILKAGGGDLALDADGITIQAGAYIGPPADSVKWIYGDYMYGEVVVLRGGISPNRAGTLYLSAYKEGSGMGAVMLSAGNYGFYLYEALGRAELRAPVFRLITVGAKIEFQDANTQVWKDASGNLTFKAGGADRMTLAADGTLRIVTAGKSLEFYDATVKIWRDATLDDLCFGTGGMGVRFLRAGGVKIWGMKFGITQAAAGAAANELWRDTDDDNTIKMGV